MGHGASLLEPLESRGAFYELCAEGLPPTTNFRSKRLGGRHCRGVVQPRIDCSATFTGFALLAKRLPEATQVWEMGKSDVYFSS